jgi:uncharacterized protein (TIGR00269 family)
MKCRRCEKRAEIELKNHNTAFCRQCFFLYFERQIKRTIDKYRMFSKDDRILVCVSGGKDSLVLLYFLKNAGYNVEALHIDLGIDGYSQKSKEKVITFSNNWKIPLKIVYLSEMGLSIPEIAKKNRRKECSLCGLIKRHFFNRIAFEGDFDVVATGHNLDDEASRLLGNILHWRMDFLARQKPVLPNRSERLKKKVQPLFKLSEREIAAYAFLKGIDYIIEECPMSKGATSLKYKEVLSRIEDEMPGTKASFLQEFLKVQHIFERSFIQSGGDKKTIYCSICGFPTFIDPCNFCKLKRANKGESKS